MGPLQDQTKFFLYIGAYGEGVYAFHFDSAAKKIEPLGLAGRIQNPSWIAPDKDCRYLYVVSELEGDAEGAVAGFSIDRRSSDLHLLNSVPSGGVAPCHLTLDKTGTVLLAANYMTGDLCVFPVLPDGHLASLAASASAFGHGLNPKRQEGPHAHFVHARDDSNLIYLVDLGLDRIRLYRLDSTHLTLTPNDPPHVQLEPGFGPRHFVFSADKRYVYLLNELQPRVTVLSHDPVTGNMAPIQTIGTLPADYTEETTGAEVALDSSGRFLYTSNRGHDSMQVFSVDRESGMIEQVQLIQIRGNFPRGFSIDPTGRFLFVAGQNSNTLEYFEIAPDTGLLTAGDRVFDVGSPVDVKFIPAS
jgi:6-phosphogluconolactonase